MVLIVDRLDFHGDLLNLIEASVVHTLLEGVLPDEFFDVQAGFLEIDLQMVYFFPEVQDGVLVNVTLYPRISLGIPLFLFGPVFVLVQHLILLSKLENQSIEFLVVDLNALQFKHLVLERVDHHVLLVIFGLSQVVGPHCSLGVVQVLRIHSLILKLY